MISFLGLHLCKLKMKFKKNLFAVCLMVKMYLNIDKFFENLSTSIRKNESV